MMNNLQALLDANGIRHFTARELLHAPRWGKYHDEPTEIVGSIIDTVKLADAIRTGWGSGVRCNSAYRPVEYNRLVGSQDTSQHVAFRAMDLSPVHGNIAKFYSVARAAVEAYRKSGKIVGFGIYNTFIHIDVGGRTANTDWDMRR
jgi:uncharacterized protein YcbK (DUF882 family)